MNEPQALEREASFASPMASVSKAKVTNALLILLLSTFLVGSGNVAQKAALDHLGPFTITAFRSILAVAVLLPFVLKETARNEPMPISVMPVILAAVLYFAASIVAQQVGAIATTATNLGFLVNMSAVFVPVLIWIMFRQKAPIMAWPSAILAVFGAYLITGAGELTATWGDALCLLAGLFDAVWIIALGYVVTRCPMPATLTAAMFSVTAFVGFLGGMFETLTIEGLVAALPSILWLGVAASAGGFLLSTKAQQSLSVCLVAIFFSFEAIFSAILGRVLLGETMTPLAFVGAAAILASVMMVQIKPRTRLLEPRKPFAQAPANKAAFQPAE
jgi:drug/metabolite transporter (DMT)-like permease